ncbi:hypothetical protein ACS0TY_029345 [Phlomoides rotata]
MGFKFKYKRNDAKRVPVTSYFQVFKTNLVHNCVGKLVSDETTCLGPKIIGDLMLQNVRAKPHLGGKEVKKEMKNSYRFDIPYWKAWRIVEAAKN